MYVLPPAAREFTLAMKGARKHAGSSAKRACGARYIGGGSPDRTFRRVRKSARVRAHGSFRSRYNEGPLRLFTRQRALTLAPTSRQPSLPPPSPPPPPRSARAPLPTPLPLRQPYPWSFSHTTPPLAINAREKVGARSRSRPLRTPSPPTLPIFPSLSHFFSPLFLFFSTERAPFLPVSLSIGAVALIRVRGWR